LTSSDFAYQGVDPVPWRQLVSLTFYSCLFTSDEIQSRIVLSSRVQVGQLDIPPARPPLPHEEAAARGLGTAAAAAAGAPSIVEEVDTDAERDSISSSSRVAVAALVSAAAAQLVADPVQAVVFALQAEGAPALGSKRRRTS
jgi:hypothetical protein